MLFLGILLIAHLNIKAIWIPRWWIKDHPAIISTLNNRFNHIYLQIFALGQAYYGSEYTPNKIVNDQWLKNLIRQAHQHRIKVSAWINVFYSWGYASRTTDPFHPLNRNPNWYVTDVRGRTILNYQPEELRRMGIEGYFLAPANPRVQAYIINIIKEIIKKYDFDGIHLDYIRYPDEKFIYDYSLRSKFLRKYYIDPANLTGLKERLGPWGYEDLRYKYNVFVNNDLTRFIARIRKTINRIRPGLELSVAVKPNILDARTRFYQDWPEWLNQGLVDYVCLMSYTPYIRRILNKTRKSIKNPRGVIIGLGAYYLSPERIKNQIEIVRQSPFSGISFFSYETLKKNPEYLRLLPY